MLRFVVESVEVVVGSVSLTGGGSVGGGIVGGGSVGGGSVGGGSVGGGSVGGGSVGKVGSVTPSK